MLEEALGTELPVLVDLSKLEFLDSTGISLLVAAVGPAEEGKSLSTAA